MIIEAIGYVGSALVLVSFLMTSVFKLRVVNTIGSLIFMSYALIIHSYPTAIMNFCLVLINLHFLWKMRSEGKEYDLVRVQNDDSYLDYILKKYDSDIKDCFPGISVNPKDASGAYLVTCNGAPAGITLGKQDSEGAMELLLDYSTPQYRDFSIGNFLMSNLKNEGVKSLKYSGPTEHHMQYLNKMGFEKKDNIFVKTL